VRILDIREKTVSIASPIANAYIDFSKMTCSVVAVITDVVRDGKPVIGYGFNSNGRYGQGALMRDRFLPRLAEAKPDSLIDEKNDNLDPFAIWNTLMTNEKPGGHGERSVAVGTIDMAVWDAVAKIAEKPLYRLLADRYRGGVGRRQGLGLCRRRLLLSGQGRRPAAGRDAQLSRPRLQGRQDEDRRRAAGRGSAPHRVGAGDRRRRPEPGGGRQRPLRPGDGVWPMPRP
jgi:L-alanine-DL-glutamate epimerase-like enolase superfamily enzyme